MSLKNRVIMLLIGIVTILLGIFLVEGLKGVIACVFVIVSIVTIFLAVSLGVDLENRYLESRRNDD